MEEYKKKQINIDWFNIALENIKFLDINNSDFVNSIYTENAINALKNIYNNDTSIFSVIKEMLIGIGKLELFECVIKEYL